MALKHVVFDLDDTLIPSSLGYSHALDRISISRVKYNSARAEVKKTIGSSHTSAHHRLLYFKRMIERSGMHPSHALDLFDSYETHLLGFIRLAWVRLGRDRLMKHLRRRGLKLSIVTNETTRTQLLKLKTIDPLGRYFDHVLTSEEVGEEKPSPRIFETLIKRARIRSGSQVALVGDSWENDIEPALHFGFLPILSLEFSSPGSYRDLGVETVETLDQIRYRL